MARKKVSIVIPTIGGSERRRQALDKGLESLFAQTIPFDEILVFDNSESRTVQKNSKYATDKRIRWAMIDIHLINPLDSWNTAVKLACNPYVTLLGDDDYAMPYAHEEIQKCLEFADLGYLPVMKVNSNGEVIRKPCLNLKSKISSNEFRYNIMLERFWTTIMGVVFFKDSFISVGGFQNALLPHYSAPDYYLWYRLSAKHSVVGCSLRNCFCYLSNMYVSDWMGGSSSFEQFSISIIKHANLIEEELLKLGITRTEIFPGGRNGKQIFIDRICGAKYLQNLSAALRNKRLNILYLTFLTKDLIKSPISIKGIFLIPLRIINTLWHKFINKSLLCGIIVLFASMDVMKEHFILCV